MALVSAFVLFRETLLGRLAFVGDSDRLVLELPAATLFSWSLEETGEAGWNPYIFCGVRATADTQVLGSNVLHWAAARFSGDALPLVLTLKAAAEFVLGFLAAYLLFLPSCRGGTALIPACAYMLSTGAFEHLNHGTPIFTNVCLLPVGLLVIRDAAGRGAWTNLALLLPVLYLQLTGGQYHINLYFLTFYFIYAVARAVGRGEAPLRTSLALCAQIGLAILLVVMIGAYQFVPLWESSLESNRVTWPFARVRDEFGQPWYAVFRLIMPHIFGNGTSFPWGTFGPHTNEFETLPIYAGAVPLSLAALTLGRLRERKVWILWGALILVILACLRTDVVAIPYYLYLRRPLQHSRLWIFVPLAIAFLAARGMEVLLDWPPGKRRRCGGIFLFLGILGAVLLWHPIRKAWTGSLPDEFLDRFKDPPNVVSMFCQGRTPEDGAPPGFDRLAKEALRPLSLTLLAFGGLILALGTERLSRRVFLWGCAALCWTDLIYAARRTLTPFARPSAEVFAEHPLSRHLSGKPELGIFRVSFDQYVPWPGADATGGRFGYNMNLPCRIPSEGGKENFIEYRHSRLLSLEQAIFQFPDRATRDPYLADLFSVRYFVVADTPENRAHYGAFCDVDFSAPGVLVFDKRDAVPRFRLVGRYETGVPAEEAFKRLEARSVDLAGEVLLEDGAAPAFPSGPLAAPGRIEIRHPHTALNRVELVVEASQPAFLVIGNSWDAGWTARVDGRTVPLRRANYKFQAVEVPAGRHAVRLDYAPLRNRWLPYFPSVGLLVWGLVTAVALIGGRNRRHAEPFGIQADLPVPDPRRWHLLFAGISLTVLAFLFFGTLLEGKAFVGDSDRLVHELPSSLFLSEALRGGEPPLWNPYSFCGARALGDAQIFSKNLVHVLLARCFGDLLPLAISWRFLLEALAGLVASYFLFLPLSPHPLAAMVPALVLPLSMGALEHLNHGTPAYTDIALFPVVLLVLRDAAARSAPANIALLTGVLYLQLTGGMYHLNLYFVPFYFGYAVWAARRAGGRSFRDVLSLWFQMGLALALVAGIGASQFASLWQASGDSNRVSWPYERVRDEFGQPWFAVFRLFLPFLYGNGLSFPWATFGPHTNEFETLPVYPGIVLLVLAVFALRAAHFRWVWGWWGAAVLLILASLRTDVAALPYFLFLRKPLQHSRLCILVPVCFAFLAPFGARLLLAARAGTLRRWAWFLCGTGAAALFLATAPVLGTWTRLLGDEFLSRFNHAPNVVSSFCQGRALDDPPPRFPELAQEALRHAGAVLLAIGAGFWLWVARRLSASAFLAWLLAVAVLETVWVGRQTLVPFARFSRDVYPENTVTRFLKEAPDRNDSRVSFDQYIRWPGAQATGDRFGYNIHSPYGIRSDGGKANFIDARYARLLALAVEDEDGEIFQVPERATRDPYFADLFATRYFVVHDDPENRNRYSAFCDLALAAEGVLVYRKREALSRYRLLAGYDLVPSGEEAFDRLRGKAVPLDRRALLEKGPPPPFPAREGAAAGTVTVERETLNAVEGTVDLPEPAILLAVNTWDAGWKAYLDDAPVPLYLANGAFQAIACPAGRHRFRIACEDRTPGTFAVARWTAAGLWGGLAAWGIIGWRRRRAAP